MTLATTERFDDYGHPSANFSRICQMWEAILGVPITPTQHALCMIAVKMSRELHQHKPDNILDIQGYAETITLLEDTNDTH